MTVYQRLGTTVDGSDGHGKDATNGTLRETREWLSAGRREALTMNRGKEKRATLSAPAGCGVLLEFY